MLKSRTFRVHVEHAMHPEFLRKTEPESPLRNTCLLIGSLLLFSAVGPILIPLIMDLPRPLVVCGVVQLFVGTALVACWFFRVKAKMMWACLIVVALVTIPNWCVSVFTILSVVE